MENAKLSSKEAISFIVILILNTIVFSADKIIAQETSSAALINSIYITILALLITFFITILFKKFVGYDILDISETIGGKILKIFIGIIYILYFILLSSIILRKISDCLQIIYYPMTNIIYILVLFIIATGVICSFKNHGIFKANKIFSIILCFCLVLIFLLNIKNYDFKNIFPILGNGINSTFVSGIGNLFTFSGLSYLYFLPPSLQDPNKFKRIALTSVAISGFFLLITIANVVFIYSHTFTNIEIFPLYICVRYIEFGTFLQRLDAIFLLFSIIAALLYISMSISVCLNIFKKTFNLSDSNPTLFPFLLSLMAISINIKPYTILGFLENNVSKYMFFIIPIGISFTVLIIANILIRRHHIEK